MNSTVHYARGRATSMSCRALFSQMSSCTQAHNNQISQHSLQNRCRNRQLHQPKQLLKAKLVLLNITVKSKKILVNHLKA
jgi:hypothetical protein